MYDFKEIEKKPSIVGYLLFTFSKVAIASCGVATIVFTYTNPELETGTVIIYTIMGIYCVLHGLSNVGSLTKYKKTL